MYSWANEKVQDKLNLFSNAWLLMLYGGTAESHLPPCKFEILHIGSLEEYVEICV